MSFPCADYTCKFNDTRGYFCRFDEWSGRKLSGYDACIGYHPGYIKDGEVWRKATRIEQLQETLDYYSVAVTDGSTKTQIEGRLAVCKRKKEELAKEILELEEVLQDLRNLEHAKAALTKEKLDELLEPAEVR